MPARLVTLMVLLAGCSDTRVTAPPAQLAFAISDAAHGGGNPGFHFLPPLVANPGASGAFDATLRPEVTVCALSGSSCASTVARFTMNDPGGEAVRVQGDDDGGHYHVNWQTKRYALDPAAVYRVAVSVAGTGLGFADVQFSAGGQARNLSSGDVVSLNDGATLPLKFRIDKGAVYVAGPAGGTFRSPDGAVTLDVPAGALPVPVGLTALAAPLPAAQLAAGGIVGGSVYQFGPAGTQFGAGGIGLTIAYDPARIPTGVNESDLRLYTLINDTLYQVPGSTVDATAHTVTGTVAHFSVYLVATQVPPIKLLTPLPFGITVGDTGDSIRVGISGPPWRVVRFFVPLPWRSLVSIDSVTGALTAKAVGLATIGVNLDGVLALVVTFNVNPLSFRQIASGNLTACGVTVERGAYCWGRNPLGVVDTNIPIRLPGSVGRGWAGVDVGFDYACGFEVPLTGPVPPGGAPLRCWGVNVTGQLGTGMLSQFAATPQTAGGGMIFVQVALGNEHACGVQADGTAWCWGNDANGQLGDGPGAQQQCTSWVFGTPAVCSPTPVRVGAPANMRFRTVDAYHGFSCGLSLPDPTTGVSAAWCWGNNDFGQLGNGTAVSTDAPVPVSMDSVPAGVTFTSVVVGQFHACALGSDARAYCWGGNAFAQLGLNGAAPANVCPTGRCQMTPRAVAGGTLFQSISAGRDHTCAIQAGGPTGLAYCWGSNQFGQSGGSLVPNVPPVVPMPMVTVGSGQFRQIEAGRQQTCGIAIDPVRSRDAAYCWGLNSWGQGGYGLGRQGTGASFGGPNFVGIQH